MGTYADIHAEVRKGSNGSYEITLSFQRTDSEALSAPAKGQANFNLSLLIQKRSNLEQYGRLLSEEFFRDDIIRSFYLRAHSTAESLGIPLRFRLDIANDSKELNALLWETMRSPVLLHEDADTFLFDGEKILFSRFIPSDDWRPVHLRPQSELCALIVISNPQDLSEYEVDNQPLASLSPQQVIEYRNQIGSTLNDIPCTWLINPGEATLNNICSHLNGGYDILYLMCHGALEESDRNGKQPVLWLESEEPGADNVTQIVDGHLFLDRLSKIEQRPRLIVLASCQSAGTNDDDGLEALGPRLAQIGIPAVLAMRGDITQETNTLFAKSFFFELRKDGQIDRAASVARGAVRGRKDWWMPRLFMRLKSGKVWWYEQGFVERSDAEIRLWPTLMDHLQGGRCTVFIGPGIKNAIAGSTREIATRWARERKVPLAPFLREEISQIAQCLSVSQDDASMRRTYLLNLCGELLRRHEALLSNLSSQSLKAALKPARGNIISTEKLACLVRQAYSEIGVRRRNNNPEEVHRILAELPFQLYINAATDGVLEDALREIGKKPQSEFFRWLNPSNSANPLEAQGVEWPHSIYDNPSNEYVLKPENPLVYHFFGSMDQVNSLVLTQDNYFDFLIAATRENSIIPEAVRSAQVNSSLLFLGFDMEDWDFRVLFRSIINREANLRGKFSHVAVQVDPEQGRFVDVKFARHFMQRTLHAPDINIYWGNSEDFVKDLYRRWLGPNQEDNNG